MKKIIGFLTLIGISLYIWSKNPQLTPLFLGLLSVGAVILCVLIFLALICYGFQMLRLFFKI